jgi:RNA polymerase sigma-70 factor (ECF subfamily)
LLRHLTPAERTAYVLREAFCFPYQQIAEILLLTAPHARQLVRRGHQRLAAVARPS